MGAASQVQVTPERILQLGWGFAPPMMIGAAVHHRVFDILDRGPKNVETVAALTGASVRGMRALMNALVGIGLLSRNGSGEFGLTTESATFLVSSRPRYLGAMLSHVCTDLMPRWGLLADLVRTGKPSAGVNQERTGTEFFMGFVDALFPMNYPAAEALAQALHVAEAKSTVRVLDLAAGSGVWGIALAQKSPLVKVTAVDFPGVLKVTRRMVAHHRLADRFSYLAGDLASADFGGGYNIATLGHILHSEGEARSRALLRKTCGALAPGGTVAIAEFLVEDDRSGPPMGLMFAVNMLVATDDGDTYSFPEISAWLREAGFENPRTVEAPGPSPLILATKAG